MISVGRKNVSFSIPLARLSAGTVGATMPDNGLSADRMYTVGTAMMSRSAPAMARPASVVISMVSGMMIPGSSKTFSRRAIKFTAESDRALHRRTRWRWFCASNTEIAVPQAPAPRMANVVDMGKIVGLMDGALTPIIPLRPEMVRTLHYSPAACLGV